MCVSDKQMVMSRNREKSHSKITDSRQSIFNKNLARKSRQQSYPGLTRSSK